MCLVRSSECCRRPGLCNDGVGVRRGRPVPARRNSAAPRRLRRAPAGKHTCANVVDEGGAMTLVVTKETGGTAKPVGALYVPKDVQMPAPGSGTAVAGS